MSDYLLIESRDPYEANDVSYLYRLAAGLAGNGGRVTLFHVQNGVLPARAGARGDGLLAAARAGVEVLADEFSLRERGIPRDGLVPGVRPAPIEAVIDALLEGRKVVWH
jgi:hypothetical protein